MIIYLGPPLWSLESSGMNKLKHCWMFSKANKLKPLNLLGIWEMLLISNIFLNDEKLLQSFLHYFMCWKGFIFLNVIWRLVKFTTSILSISSLFRKYANIFMHHYHLANSFQLLVPSLVHVKQIWKPQFHIIFQHFQNIKNIHICMYTCIIKSVT